MSVTLASRLHGCHVQSGNECNGYLLTTTSNNVLVSLPVEPETEYRCNFLCSLYQNYHLHLKYGPSVTLLQKSPAWLSTLAFMKHISTDMFINHFYKIMLLNVNWQSNRLNDQQSLPSIKY